MIYRVWTIQTVVGLKISEPSTVSPFIPHNVLPNDVIDSVINLPTASLVPNNQEVRMKGERFSGFFHPKKKFFMSRLYLKDQPLPWMVCEKSRHFSLGCQKRLVKNSHQFWRIYNSVLQTIVVGENLSFLTRFFWLPVSFLLFWISLIFCCW